MTDCRSTHNKNSENRSDQKVYDRISDNFMRIFSRCNNKQSSRNKKKRRRTRSRFKHRHFISVSHSHFQDAVLHNNNRSIKTLKTFHALTECFYYRDSSDIFNCLGRQCIDLFIVFFSVFLPLSSQHCRHKNKTDKNRDKIVNPNLQSNKNKKTNMTTGETNVEAMSGS